jgi:exopolysaccharide production repressor protein
MYAPRVFFSMICALLIFAVASFFLTHSVWTVVIHTVIAAVLLQVGYFGGVLFLVLKAAREKNVSLQPTKPLQTKEKLEDSSAVAPKKFS